MAAVQPIPINTPNSATVEAAEVFALHERSTANRNKPRPARQYGRTRGENPGTRVAGSTNIAGGAA